MRKSSLRHPIAILRQVLGINQPDFATVVGIPESTLAKIETTRLPLSAENAIRIATETGVSHRWLMKGDCTAPIQDESGRPFTEAVFAATRAARGRGEYADFRHLDEANAELPMDLHSLLLALHSAQLRANEPLAAWRLHQFVRGLANEFGESDPRKGMRYCLSRADELVSQIKGAGTRSASGPTYKIGKARSAKANSPKPRPIKKA